MQKLLLLPLFLLSAQIALAQLYGEGLVINEFMASNDSLSGIADPNGQFEDWVELYNNSSNTLNLESFFLSDKADNLQKWIFPAGATIEPDGYLIIWCDEDGSQEGLHANFKLSKDGEFLALSNPFGELLDSLSFGPQETNMASARRPNGTGDFMIQNPTFGFNNDQVNSVFDRFGEAGMWKLAPNPTDAWLTFHWQGEGAPDILNIEVLNYAGQVVKRQASGMEIALHDLLPGLYILRLDTGEGIFTEKFAKY